MFPAVGPRFSPCLDCSPNAMLSTRICALAPVLQALPPASQFALQVCYSFSSSSSPLANLLPGGHVQGASTSDFHSFAALTIGSMRPRGKLSIQLGGASSLSELLPRGVVGSSYPSFSVAALLQNVVNPLTFFLYSAGLPKGMRVDRTSGEISGTPSVHGTFAFTIGIYDLRLPRAVLQLSVKLTIAMAGDVLVTTDFASPLASGWLLRGSAAAATDEYGSFLRLTDGSAGSYGSAEYRIPLVSDEGLDIRFVQAHYDGAGGEGIAMYLRDGTSTSTDMGVVGIGALGYSPDMRASLDTYYQRQPTAPDRGGMPGALLAVGMTASGLFTSEKAFNGPECDGFFTTFVTSVANSIAIRGGSVDGSNTTGYCYIKNGLPLTFSPANAQMGSAESSRFNRTRSIRITLSPIADGEWRALGIYVQDSGSFIGVQEMTYLSLGEYPSLAPLASASSVYLGFAAEGGSGSNKHAITKLEVATLAATTRQSRAAGTTWVADNFPAQGQQQQGQQQGQQVASVPAAPAVWRTTSSDSSSIGLVTSQSDAEGTFLRLTGNIDVSASIELLSPVPLSHGLDVRFVQAQVSNKLALRRSLLPFSAASHVFLCLPSCTASAHLPLHDTLAFVDFLMANAPMATRTLFCSTDPQAATASLCSFVMAQQVPR